MQLKAKARRFFHWFWACWGGFKFWVLAHHRAYDLFDHKYTPLRPGFTEHTVIACYCGKLFWAKSEYHEKVFRDYMRRLNDDSHTQAG